MIPRPRHKNTYHQLRVRDLIHHCFKTQILIIALIDNVPTVLTKTKQNNHLKTNHLPEFSLCVLWEAGKMLICGKIISYVTRKKRNKHYNPWPWVA